MQPRTDPVLIITTQSNITYAIARAALALALTAIAYGCGAQSQNFATTATPVHGAHSNVVLASWYGPGFEGHHTSSGERFHQNGLTAASRTLPLGSHIRVTNLSTGRSVVVRVNDRGPYVKGRGLDLSHAAARRIGLVRDGVDAVRVTRLDGTWGEVGDDDGAVAENAKPRRTYRHHSREPIQYAGTSGVTPIAATTESSSMVSNPIGSWLTGLFR